MMPDNGYFRAKVAQEKLIETSGIPYNDMLVANAARFGTAPSPFLG
jgi:uncharacterized protein YbjT (DUF2867 family)